jgi:hypothetical protein
MEYTNLDLGIDYLPYWDDESDTTESETEQATETTELNNIELPF